MDMASCCKKTEQSIDQLLLYCRAEDTNKATPSLPLTPLEPFLSKHSHPIHLHMYAFSAVSTSIVSSYKVISLTAFIKVGFYAVTTIP